MATATWPSREATDSNFSKFYLLLLPHCLLSVACLWQRPVTISPASLLYRLHPHQPSLCVAQRALVPPAYTETGTLFCGEIYIHLASRKSRLRFHPQPKVHSFPFWSCTFPSVVFLVCTLLSLGGTPHL